MSRKHCPTGKIEYGTRPQARLQAEHIRKQTGLTLSVYGCPHCLFFHLTKKADAATDSDLRRMLACQGAQIAASETAYLRKRLGDLAVEIAGDRARLAEKTAQHREGKCQARYARAMERKLQAAIRRSLGLK